MTFQNHWRASVPADARRLDVQEDLTGPGRVHRGILHQDLVVCRYLEGRVRVARGQRGVVHCRGRDQHGLYLCSRHGGLSSVMSQKLSSRKAPRYQIERVIRILLSDEQVWEEARSNSRSILSHLGPTGDVQAGGIAIISELDPTEAGAGYGYTSRRALGRRGGVVAKQTKRHGWIAGG